MSERKEMVIIRYVGKCPECGVEQESRDEEEADRVCDECRKRYATNEFMSKLDFLRGARILDFKGECHLNHDGSLDGCIIVSLTVVTKDRRILNVTTKRGLWQAVER